MSTTTSAPTSNLSTDDTDDDSLNSGLLFPGYKQVDQFEFADDGDDEYDVYDEEVEECYVTLDLGSVDQALVSSCESYRLVGLDTPTPFLQLSKKVMKGQVRTLIGTELIFKDVSEESSTPRSRSPLPSPLPSPLHPSTPPPTNTTPHPTPHPTTHPTTTTHPHPHPHPPTTTTTNTIKYLTKTTKRIQFQELSLKPKKEPNDANDTSNSNFNSNPRENENENGVGNSNSNKDGNETEAETQIVPSNNDTTNERVEPSSQVARQASSIFQVAEAAPQAEVIRTDVGLEVPTDQPMDVDS